MDLPLISNLAIEGEGPDTMQGRWTYLWQAVHNTHSQRSREKHPRTQRAGRATGTGDPIL